MLKEIKITPQAEILAQAARQEYDRLQVSGQTFLPPEACGRAWRKAEEKTGIKERDVFGKLPRPQPHRL